MTEYIDPNDHVITRKRKKYKFAKFHNSPLCFEYEEWTKRGVDSIEVGAGTGLFSVERARLYPDKTFVAVDVKGDRLQTGAYYAMELGLENVFFVRARADQLLDCFESDSASEVWVTFPDPFPRERSARRRLTHTIFLDAYATLLSSNGALYHKTDSLEMFHWTLEHLVEHQWQLLELSFDLHESELSEEYKLLTTYERRWMSEGSRINFVKATRSDTSS